MYLAACNFYNLHIYIRLYFISVNMVRDFNILNSFFKYIIWKGESFRLATLLAIIPPKLEDGL